MPAIHLLPTSALSFSAEILLPQLELNAVAGQTVF